MTRKKTKIKWKNVLITTISLMIIIGGFITYQMKKSNNLKPDQTSTANNQGTTSNGTTNTDSTNATLEKAPTTTKEFATLSDGEYQTKTGHTLVIKDRIATIDGHLIVNKTYALPSSYQPLNSYVPLTGERCNNCLEKEVMEAFKLMQSDATSIGLNIYIASGYRSYNYQNNLYTNYSAVSGTDEADTYSARPGHSEHQTGLCFDLNSVDDSFATTEEGKWIHQNAYLYGFVIRYPKGKETETGYQYEPWHLRYVGKSLAKELYQDGTWQSLEEYYGLTSTY